MGVKSKQNSRVPRVPKNTVRKNRSKKCGGGSKPVKQVTKPPRKSKKNSRQQGGFVKGGSPQQFVNAIKNFLL
jgi:hypothetical protein